jgi:uncharacterized protein (DUF608 family)
MTKSLFPIHLPPRKWLEFKADGFSEAVSGAIFHSDDSPTCGVPLGSIGTGCLDLEATGTFGLCSIFNTNVPRRGPLNLPFLGLNVGGKTVLLSAPAKVRLNNITWPRYWEGSSEKLRPLHRWPIERVHYWGHYPVADLEFWTDEPVKVGLRAWTPFLPGDVTTSNTPGAVFEVRLRNSSDAEQKGTIAFSFPGPTPEEGGTKHFQHEKVKGKLKGVAINAPKASYVLGVIDEEKARFGGELGFNGKAWADIAQELPEPEDQPGSSVAVDFLLKVGEEKVVRFVLSWYSPEWQSGGTPTAGGNTFTHMYATRYGSAVEVAEYLAKEHESLLRRILAWQEVIYGDKSLPIWLRDSLVNILHLITEDGLWAMAKPPVGDWCKPEDGLFGLLEDPRNCPQTECIPCSFYGNQAVVYFFPELALSTLRAYKAYQLPDGAAPWCFGGLGSSSGFCELTVPSRGYQTTTNGPCLVDMVDRYWLRTGDEEFLREFYPYVKKNTTFTMSLRPEYPTGDAVIAFPTKGDGEWFEDCHWAGMTAHVGDIHLANIKMAERMAEKVGDEEFLKQCREWLELGAESMETKLWIGEYYLNWLDPSPPDGRYPAKKSELIMSNQLDGEWMARFHGLPNILQVDRIKKTLETVKRTGVAATPIGAVNFTTPDGILTSTGYAADAYFPPEVLMLGMTYMYQGEMEFGLELCRRCWENIVLAQGWGWEQPNIVRGDNGQRIYGADYYQNMMLWSLPAAIEGKGFDGPCEPGGLVDRMIRAATGKT